MSARAVLDDAARVLLDRATSYGPPASSFAAIAARWSITLGQPVTPQQVALCMIDLKLARLAHHPTHNDSVVDVIGYAGLLPEVTQ